MKTLDATRAAPRMQPGDGTRLDCIQVSSSTLQVTASAPNGRPGVRLEVDLGDAVAYWQPGGRGARALPPDWSERSTTSLVESAPLGVLHDAAGRALIGWAAGEPVAELSIRYGVSEENKSFIIEVRPELTLDRELILIIDLTGDRLTTVASRLAAWLAEKCPEPARHPSPAARQPVYSTWYTFAQDIDHEHVVEEAKRAVTLGLRSVFIDDGWQRFGHGRGYQGCGDWLPDTDKFPDLAATISTIRGVGASTALWIAPLLLGAQSDAFDDLKAFAPTYEHLLKCWVLDPRREQVRRRVADTCLRLVTDYGVDLLKIDFLDQAMLYRDLPSEGDVDDVGLAMELMLTLIRERLDDAGHAGVGFEFRQPYVSPALARFGDILRANDCPGDATTNRAATIDARLISTGSVVHSDPLMWGVEGGVEAVAQQFYAAWFAVPQVSMELDRLPPEQSSAVDRLLSLWHAHSPVTLDGQFDASGSERGYDLAQAVRTDLDQAVIARYAPLVIDLGPTPARETTILNATPDTRLVLRSTRPILSGLVRTAAAELAGAIAPCSEGLIELAVPAFGSVTILT